MKNTQKKHQNCKKDILRIIFSLFFEGLLDDLDKFGCKFESPGKVVANLSEEISNELGFAFHNPNVSIASSLIDAHAGMLSMLVFGNTQGNWEGVVGLISGTSACHMMLNSERTFSEGIWGPYKHAIIPNFYLREAGQSATGKLIDDIISNYYDKAPSKEEIGRIIKNFNEELSKNDYFYKSPLLINPSFHGNRSPIGRSDMKGAIYGLTLEKTKLFDLYTATIEALAFETKYILERAEQDDIKKFIVTGGLAKNEFYMQIHSDILQCPLVTFSAGDADLMLVGASVIAFCSTIPMKKIEDLIFEMSQKNLQFEDGFKIYYPREEAQTYFAPKYSSFRKFLLFCTEIL